MKKILIYIILTILILFSNSCFAAESQNNTIVTSPTEEKPDIKDINITSNCILLVEKDSGDIILEKNAYEKMYPASTTKILTAILVLENCDLNEIATVSSVAVRSVPATYATSGLQIRWKASCWRFATCFVNSFC